MSQVASLWMWGPEKGSGLPGSKGCAAPKPWASVPFISWLWDQQDIGIGAGPGRRSLQGLAEVGNLYISYIPKRSSQSLSGERCPEMTAFLFYYCNNSRLLYLVQIRFRPCFSCNLPCHQFSGPTGEIDILPSHRGGRACFPLQRLTAPEPLTHAQPHLDLRKYQAATKESLLKGFPPHLPPTLPQHGTAQKND